MTSDSTATDRRLSENAMLRKLVDAIKVFISARDAIWTLGSIDRIFRTKRYSKVYTEYEEATATVNTVIRAMAIRNNNAMPVISSEEIDALVRMTAADPYLARDRQGDSDRKRKSESASKTVGPAFKPIVPPASSIAPTTPSGANPILEQTNMTLLSNKDDDV